MMKKIFGMAAISALAFSMFACSDGEDGVDGVNGKDGSDGISCSVKALKDSSGFKVLCDGDSVGVLLNAADGKAGKNGADGKAGKDGEDGASGDGKTGENGKDGAAGKNGTGCTANAVKDGFQIVCGADTVGTLTNGKDGTAGKNGEDCSLKDNGDGIVTVTCGETTVNLFKATCDYIADVWFAGGSSVAVPYDPETQLCFHKLTLFEDGSYGEVNVALPKCADQTVAGLDGDASEYPYDPNEYFCDKNELVQQCHLTDNDGNDSVVTKYDAATHYCDLANNMISPKVPCSDKTGEEFYTVPGKYCYRDASTPKTKMLYKDSADCFGVKYNPVTHFCKSSEGDLGTRSICAKTPASADQYDISIRYDSEENVDSHEGQMCDTRDWNVYGTRTAMGLTWMTEPLRYALPGDKGKTADLDSGSFCYYNDCNEKNGIRAYLWSAVIDSAKLNSGSDPKVCGYGKPACTFTEPYQGICPDGWHVPGQTEYDTYSYDYDSPAYLNGNGWSAPVAYQTDMTASTLIGRKAMSYYTDSWIHWSILDSDEEKAFVYDSEYGIADYDSYKYYAHPVRCVKD